MEIKKIVMLGSIGNSTNIIFHLIHKSFPIHTVIIEEKENKRAFLRRRIKKMGLITVVGQVLFQMIVVKLLNIFSAARIKNIIAENELNIQIIPADKINHVRSINEINVVKLLKEVNPDLVIINGTRIISKTILNAVDCQFINTHAGITPMYRGVHGGYWALVNDDVLNCGVTVHLVDEGIDTGSILYQDTIQITKKDNFVTYPYLQISKVQSILLKAVEDALKNKLNRTIKSGRSKIWYHPTIWQYLYYRVSKSVK